MIFEYELLIREFHLDSYGHVNNATYLSMYEEARWEAITKRGYGYSHVHKTGIGPVILDVHIKFMKELVLREKIKITMELVSYEGKIFKLKQSMVKQNGEIASEAMITGALFDLASRKIIPPTPDWSQAVGNPK